MGIVQARGRGVGSEIVGLGIGIGTDGVMGEGGDWVGIVWGFGNGKIVKWWAA